MSGRPAGGPAAYRRAYERRASGGGPITGRPGIAL